MTLDLSTLDTKTPAERGILVELENPFTPGDLFVDDGGKPYWIRILGADAGKIREKSRKQLDKHITLIRKNRELGDAESGEQELIDKLAAATLEWYLPPLDGKPMPEASEKAARALYSDPRFPWLVEQLTKAMGDRARFFAKSSSS